MPQKITTCKTFSRGNPASNESPNTTYFLKVFLSFEQTFSKCFPACFSGVISQAEILQGIASKGFRSFSNI